MFKKWEAVHNNDTNEVNNLKEWVSPLTWPSSDNLDDWNLRPQCPNWAAEFIEYWSPGEKGPMTVLMNSLKISQRPIKLSAIILHVQAHQGYRPTFILVR